MLWGSRALEWSIGKTSQGLDGGTEETGSVGRQTASRAWDGTAQSLERRYMVRGGVCCLALTLRRSLRPVYPDFVCASSRNGCLPDARNTSGGVYPGRGVEELRPGMTTPQAYRGAEGRDSSDGACGGRGVTARSDPAAELRKAAGCSQPTDTESG